MEFLRWLFIVFLVSSIVVSIYGSLAVRLQGGKPHPLALLICCVLGNQNTNRESIGPEGGRRLEGRSRRKLPDLKGRDVAVCVLMVPRPFFPGLPAGSGECSSSVAGSVCPALRVGTGTQGFTRRC